MGPEAALISSAVVSGVAAAGGGVMSYMESQKQAAQQRANAIQAQRASAQEMAIARDRQERVRGQQVAAAAAQGLNLSGSPLLAVVEGEVNFGRDQILRQSSLEFQRQAYQRSADSYMSAGFGDMAGGFLGAADIGFDTAHRLSK